MTTQEMPVSYEVRRPGNTAWLQDIPSLDAARQERAQAERVVGGDHHVIAVYADGHSEDLGSGWQED